MKIRFKKDLVKSVYMFTEKSSFVKSIKIININYSIYLLKLDFLLYYFS